METPEKIVEIIQKRFQIQRHLGGNMLRVFRNHVSMITAVYINNNAGVKPVKAELLGQDALNLVTDVKIQSCWKRYNNV